MLKRQCSILFLGPKTADHVEKALSFCKLNFADVTAHLADWGDPLPEGIGCWEGEFLVSYLSRWVLPEYLLNRAKGCGDQFSSRPTPVSRDRMYELRSVRRSEGIRRHLPSYDTAS